MVNALPQWPRVNTISIAYHQDLASMIDDYKSNIDFAQIYEQVTQGVPISHYSIKKEFLMFGSQP